MARRTSGRTVLRRMAKHAEMERRAAAVNATIINRPIGRSKFHNVATVYKGVRYSSLGEAEYAWRLDQKVATGEIAYWERPKPIVLVDAPRARERVTMVPDFHVTLHGGGSYYVDYKGSRITETPVFRLKVRLWRNAVPFELRVAYPDGTEKVVATGEIPV